MKPQSLFWVLLVSLVLLVGVVSADDPWATFVPGSVSGTAPYTVTFVSISYNDPTAWSWTFRDIAGNNTEIEFGTTENVTYTFHYRGTYLIRLNASNTDGYNITPDLVYVTVSGPLAPSPVFASSCNVNTEPDAIASALTMFAVMLVGIGCLGIIYTLGSLGGFIGDQPANMWIIISSISAIMVGAVLLLLTYFIISPISSVAVC